MCSVEVFHGDDGCTSSDLDGGDKLGEKKVIGRGKGKFTPLVVVVKCFISC